MTRIFLMLMGCCPADLVRPMSDPVADRLITSGVELMYDLDFPSADNRFDSLITLYPNHPQGYFFKGGSYFYQIISGHTSDMPEEKFIEWNEKALDVADEFEDATRKVDEADFYRGAIYGNLGRFYAVNSEWVKAFYYTRKSKNLHRDLIERDSTWYDAYLSVGVYEYYAAQLPKIIDMLAGMLGLSGRREEGIAMLTRAYRFGRLGKLEAQFMLANVYIDEGRYEDAQGLYRDMAGRFVHNPYLRNQLALSSFLLDRYTEARDTFDDVYRSAKQYPRAQMFAAYHLGRVHKLNKRFAEAEKLFLDAVEKGSRQPLFRHIDGWVPASAWYHAGETAELDGRREAALAHFARSRDVVGSTKGIAQAAKNRIQYAWSPLERGILLARYDVLTGSPAGEDSLKALLPIAQDRTNRKFVAQIRYYLAYAAYLRSDFDAAAMNFSEALRVPENDLPWIVPHAQYYLAVCHARLSRNDEAVKVARSCMKTEGYPEEMRIRFLCTKLLKELEG